MLYIMQAVQMVIHFITRHSDGIIIAFILYKCNIVYVC